MDHFKVASLDIIIHSQLRPENIRSICNEISQKRYLAELYFDLWNS